MQGPRGTKPEEFDEVTELVNLVFHGGRRDIPTMKERFPMLFNEWNLENLRIIVEDGKVVSHIGVSQREISVYGCKTKVGSIGSVCTHPDYRQRGFATKILDDTIKMLDANGATVMIISGGRGLYRRAGCRSVGKRYHFNISRSDLDKFPDAPDVEIASYLPTAPASRAGQAGQEEEHLRKFAEIQQREPIRFLRPLDDFRAMLDVIVKERDFRHTDALSIQSNGTCLAYMVMNISQKRDSEELVCRIGEYAGSRLAIMSAISMLFQRHDFDELSLGILPQDTEFLYILKPLGLKPSTEALAGTMKIINLPRLMEHFMPYLQGRLGRETANALQFDTDGDRHLFQLEDEQFVIENEADLVQFTLSTPDDAELALIPEEGKIAEALREIFPLPFVWPGLNHV